MKIVLLGSLPKGDEARNDWLDWKPAYIETISKVLPSVEFVHGDAISDSVGTEIVVGHDLYQVQQADICVVDAKSKIGAGTAQEMVFAKSLKKPVVTVIPKDSHHRKSKAVFHGIEMKDWIHPFLKLTSDYIADSINDAAGWLEQYVSSPEDFDIKDLSVFDKAIQTYTATQPDK